MTTLQPDLAELRRDFPGLEQQVNGNALVYLDNGASSQMCRAAIDAVHRHQLNDRANVHRGVHTLSQRATTAMESGRESVQRFIGARSVDEIIFVRGTTEAINLVASTFGQRFEPGDEIVISHMEHHSNIVPWQLLAARTGVTLKVVPVDDDGVLDMQVYEQLLSDRTRLVSVVHVSNTLGTVNPVRRVVELAHARGVPVLLDGAQAAPHLPIDVVELGCDFYAFSGHKVFGPNGIGVLYGRHEMLCDLPPWQGGGDMIESVSFEGSTWAEPPGRFEAGTPNVSGIVGLGAAVDYLMSVGMGRIQAYEAELASQVRQALADIPGLRFIGDAPGKAAVFSFVLHGIPSADVGTLLDMQGVAVRTGHHCTSPLMQRFGVPGTVRASFCFYNTVDDLQVLIQGLHKVRRMFG
ncbi:MAG: cysteine desulfurase/selenocysteine lyase [Kiritimatiellia bacterium]|jgi:cysteine desulfurase/selenocysteine lyase